MLPDTLIVPSVAFAVAGVYCRFEILEGVMFVPPPPPPPQPEMANRNQAICTATSRFPNFMRFSRMRPWKFSAPVSKCCIPIGQVHPPNINFQSQSQPFDFDPSCGCRRVSSPGRNPARSPRWPPRCSSGGIGMHADGTNLGANQSAHSAGEASPQCRQGRRLPGHHGKSRIARTSRCARSASATSRRRWRTPPFQELSAATALPSSVRGPVDCSHGRQVRISSACRCLRSKVHPFAMLGLQ